MDEYMRQSVRKLALWYTRNFKPLMTHEELEPIMATLGFVGLPPVANGVGKSWKEYVYTAGRRKGKSVDSSTEKAEPLPPRPRLPHPRIDGAHIYTYRAFLDAVSFYIEMRNISDLFHIRGMPLSRIHDRNRRWRRMEEDDSVFVYREGTVDQATVSLYRAKKIGGGNNSEVLNGGNDDGIGNGQGFQPIVIRNKGSNIPAPCVVPLKDIIVYI